jgi:Zn-dependent protease with chaperone function
VDLASSLLSRGAYAGAVLLLAVLPGLYAAWRGRALRSDDPLLVDRMTAYRGSIRGAALFTIVVALLFFGAQKPWLVPLQIVAVLIGGFPSRRRLYEEHWTLVTYLAHTVRVFTAFLGPWLLLALTPAFVLSVEVRGRLPLAIGLMAATYVWLVLYGRVLRRLLGARPLERADLEPAFAAIVAKSRIAAPLVCRAGARGGRWANAFALPGTKAPAVVITDTLLEAAAADELAAIFAHEVAHLEHYDKRRLRRSGKAALLLIVLGGFVLPALFPVLGAAAPAACWLWGLCIPIGLAVRAAKHRQHEADSDRRAVGLGADPAALGRGLVKLHALALLPRRWDPRAEEWASHPSLAQRLKALDALAAAPDHAPEPPALAVRAGDRAWVILAERAYWLDGVPEATAPDPDTLRAAAGAVRSYAYGELTDLRLDSRRNPVQLVAADRQGRTWRNPIAGTDAPALYRAIATVDTRLGTRKHAPTSVLASLTSLLALVVAPSIGALATMLVGLIACLRPRVAALAALAACGIVQAAADPPLGADAWHVWGGRIVLAAVSILAVIQAYRAARTRTEEPSRVDAAVPAALGVACLLAWLPAAIDAFAASTPIAVEALGRSSAAAALSAAWAAALLCDTQRTARALAAAALSATIAALACHSPAVRAALGSTLLPEPTRVLEAEAPLDVFSARPLPPRTWDVRLSPSGNSFAALRGAADADDDGDEEMGAFDIYAGARVTPQVSAVELLWIDESSLLALRQDSGGKPRLERLDTAGATTWRLDLPALTGPRLSVEAGGGLWQILGYGAGQAGAVRWRGTVGDGRYTTSALHAPSGAGVSLAASVSNDAAFAVRLDLPTRSYPLPALWVPFAGTPRFHSELWRIDSSAPVRLGRIGGMLQCQPLLGTEPELLCFSTDGAARSLWSVNASRGLVQPIGRVNGYLIRSAPCARGTALATTEGALVVDAHSGRVTPLALPRAARASAVAAYDEGVALVVREAEGTSSLHVYRIPR